MCPWVEPGARMGGVPPRSVSVGLFESLLPWYCSTYCVALSGTRALQLRNAREARGGKKKSSRDEHGVLE